MMYTKHSIEELNRLEELERDLAAKVRDYTRRLEEVRHEIERGKWCSRGVSFDATAPEPHCYHCGFQERPGCKQGGNYGTLCDRYVYHREAVFHEGCGGVLKPDMDRVNSMTRTVDDEGVALYTIAYVCDKCGADLPGPPVCWEAP